MAADAVEDALSLGLVIKSPSGLVLAADSRVTLGAQNIETKQTFLVHFDNATKVLRFNKPHTYVAAVTYGMAVVPGHQRTAESYLPEFEQDAPQKRLSVEDFAQLLSKFYESFWKDALKGSAYTDQPMVFLVGGYDEKAPYGRVFTFNLPGEPKPVEQHVDNFGASWGGQMEIVDRIYKGWQSGLPERVAKLMGLDVGQQAKLREALNKEELQIPIGAMALQDCVNLAVTLIRTTIRIQELAVTVRGVGGPIDVVTITRTDGVKVVKFKEVGVHDAV